MMLQLFTRFTTTFAALPLFKQSSRGELAIDKRIARDVPDIAIHGGS
jgi:hypothetical protein